MEKGLTVWLTGIPGAEKSTIAKLLEQQLLERGLRVQQLDGQAIRMDPSNSMNPANEPSKQDSVAWIVDVILPSREAREKAKQSFGGVIEVFVKCPPRVLACEPASLRGIEDPFEEPLDPEIVVETDRESPEEIAGMILGVLEERNCIPRAAISGTGYSEEEEAAVRQRLEDLGYL